MAIFQPEPEAISLWIQQPHNIQAHTIAFLSKLNNPIYSICSHYKKLCEKLLLSTTYQCEYIINQYSNKTFLISLDFEPGYGDALSVSEE